MIFNAAKISLVVAVLSLGASATSFGSDDTNNPSLNARAGLCCGLAVDNRDIQTVCQYMYENCGGWDKCVQGNDNQWCRHCVVNHPEDPACIRLTWPPVDPAPVGKRDLDSATISPLDDNPEDNGLVKQRDLKNFNSLLELGLLVTRMCTNELSNMCKQGPL
tara:strand:- start:835 stop:1320 length:486 start_codon:yes stop_codon:yes gene_type:complete